MVFPSPLFLFAYLPAVLACYLLWPKKLKNATLLTISLLFYLAGGGEYILILFSIGTDYLDARGPTVDQKPLCHI
jgi:alginate O-acetyltransferase complex protein AlgI